MKLQSLVLIAALVAACWLLSADPDAVSAAETRSGPNAQVQSGETIDDDLFAGGQTVTISGHVTGDAYAAGETIIVNGTIDGDLLAAGQQVIVDGTIGGNVRGAAGTITINGSVGRSVTGLAQHVNFTTNSRINGSLVALGQAIDAFGQIGRGVTVGGGSLQLAGPVGGPVRARVDTLSVAPTAHLASTLEYQSQQEAALPTGAVSGEVHFTPAPQQAPQPAPLLNGLLDLGGLIGLVGAFVLGALAITLLPRASARAAELGRQQPWLTFGLGLAVLVLTPIVALIVGVTLIGIPLALCIVGTYVVALCVAWPAAGLVVGTQLMRLVNRERPLPVLVALAVGLIVLHLVTHLPFLGPLVALCALVFGLGMVAQTVRRWRRPTEHPRIEAPVAAAA